MSSQPEFQAARVVLISAPEDEQVADYLDDHLGRRGKYVDWIELSGPGEKNFPVDIITGAENEVVILVIGRNKYLLDSLVYVIARTRQIICVLVDDVFLSFFKENPILGKSYIDFRDSKFREQQMDMLNNVISGSVPRDRIDKQEQRLLERLLLDQNNMNRDEPQNLPSGSVLLTLTSDNDKVENTCIVSEEVTRLFLVAKQLKSTANDSSGPEVEFTFLLKACAEGNTRLSRWFQNFIERTKATIPGFTDSVEVEPIPIRDRLDKTIRIFASVSVRELFSIVEGFTKESTIDVSHLLSAFIYYPRRHEKDYKEWNLDRKAWSLSFLGYMQRFHSDELQRVINEHRGVFSEQPVPDTRDNPVDTTDSGLSAHIAPDMWTTDDELDYRPYAYAIARFLTHPRTTAPLTVSIQAPWGGGKTSLMRMIQKELDAPATQPGKNEPAQPKSLHMKVRDVLREIEKKLHPDQSTTDTAPDTEYKKEKFVKPPETPPARPDDTKEPIEPKMTVWFNVWKYESINQVWAGLVDAILRQVTERMTPFEREKFWLQLTFKRVDADTIRQTIHDRILRYMWQYSRKILFWAGGVFIASLLLMLASWTGGLVATSGTLLTTLFLVWQKYKKASEDVKDEPASISLREYVSAPDYTAELGFVHYAETDFRKLLACIPERYKPLVIFIDDLDRCSPGRVAQVMEAINLFLAGEFPDCMFVLGMDSEMVAAALQAAHSDVIQHLPLDAGIPVGWRFMEKFIQLPFIIPPCGTLNIRRYTASLFKEKKRKPDPVVVSTAQEVIAALSVSGYRKDEVHRLSSARGLTVEQTEQVVEQARVQAALRTIDRGIREFADRYEQVQGLIEAEAGIFRGNPRDLKRFVNTFRFHYFLWWAQKSAANRESDVASLEQIIRWTAFSIRWPEVVRWLWRGSGSYRPEKENEVDSGDGRKTASRMKQLEDTCTSSNDSQQWEEALQKAVFPGATEAAARDLHWMRDAELYFFLQREVQRESEKRLSAAVGKGLW